MNFQSRYATATYADDVTLFSESKLELQVATHIPRKICRDYSEYYQVRNRKQFGKNKLLKIDLIP